MPFRPCVSGCGRYLAPGDGHDRCLSCLGIEHAEAAFVDESCPHCGGMTVAGLRTRLRFLQRGGVPVPLPRSRVPPGGYRGEATSGSSRAGLTVTVRNSPKTARAPPVTGTSLPMELPRERAGPSHGGGVPLVSFGAPPDDRMSIATLEGESDQSGDDGSVPLPPSGRSAVPDSDPEMVAMLARAAESVGLEWRPPLCPEPSRLDDWFLGVARAGSQGPTPVPFFPEVHDELTGTWTAPFTARNRSSGSSSLATLDGGAARGYTEVPPVERSVAMQLCPRTASTWRGNPLLPSRACRHSSALNGSAYAACGEAASALHAMALLQVHQAKALRDLHEGGHDPGVLSELRTATDLALRATKVTARSLGRAMSTMVVQERHLWLCLADMKEADKARFLNAPVSQTGLFGDAVENFAQQFSAAQKQTEAIRHILPRRAAAASTRPPAAVPRSTRRRGRPPAAAPAPAQQTQQPPAKQRRGAGRRAAAPPVQAPAKPGGKRRSKWPWDGRPRDGDVCSSGDGERTTPSPGGGPGGESFVSFSATGLTVSGTQNLDKRAVSSISGSPEGTGGCERVKLELHSPSSLASGQLWAVREGGQSHYSRTLCQNAGKCVTHADPASDRQRDARAGSLRSPSLPHRGYVSGFVGVTSTVLGGLASAPQPVSLAPPYHQTRLCDSVRPATSQVSRHPLHHSEGSGCPHLASRDRSPTGEGRDRAGPSSRYEVGVLQPLLHCTQEKRWVKTNLGSARFEPGPSQAPVQNAHTETHLWVRPSPRLVCSDRPEGRVLPCVDPSAPQAIPAVCVRRTGISVQSPALRAVPVAPCLHESSGGSPGSPERTGRAHSKLPRRLAYTSSVAGPVMRTQGHGALAPQPVGPSGQLGKEQTLPGAEDLFSRYGVRLGQSDSAPHAGTRSVGVELLEYIQEQDSGTTETVSEAPGAYGGCGGGHAAGAAPYETASTLAPWPSPEVGVAERHAEGPSHSSLPPNLHPVVRPFIPSGRSAPGTGLQARCGLHRRLRQGLGGHVQRACSVRGLDGSPTALAHQLPRVAGSTPGLEPSQETLTRRACTSPYGQHGDRCVHQPTRWSTLPSHVTTRPPPPPLESEASEVASRHSYPGLAQPDSRRAVTSCAPRRMETPSPDGPADLATFWTRTGRPVRVPRDVALPVVLLPDRWNTRHGRTGTQLAAGPSQICISPSEPSRTDSVQGQRGRGADPARGTILAYQDLVPRADTPRDSPSLADSSEEGSTDSETGHLMAPASRPLETSCLVPRRDAEVLGDLPQEVVDTITSARAPSTRHAYALKWNLFVEWCSSHREDPRRCPIRVVLSFLQQGLERRLSPSTLKVYVAAIAANHDPVEGKSVGKHDWVVRFLRGARRLNPPRPPSIPSWDLSLVLRALQQGPFEPLQTVEPKFLSMKTLLLLALASIKRVGDLHAFQVDDSCLQFGPADSQIILRPRPGYVPKVPTTPFRDQVVSLQALPPEEADPALALLCPVRALRHYVDRTQSFRTSDQLFVCHGGRQKGKAVSKQRMAHWIVDAITLAYQAQGVPCPFRLRAHSTRSVASSWALARGASLTDICRAAGWATPNTFARFYSLRVEPVSSCVLTSNG